MMKMNKSQNMNEMMNKMSESEKTMRMEKMMGMCMCHDCSTMKDCSMNMDCSKTPSSSMTSSSMNSCMDPSMASKMGMFCSMDGRMMMTCESQKMGKMECMCTTCSVASDMGMTMTTPA
jgi:hypothetical protein